MPTAGSDPSLVRRLDEARRESEKPLTREEIADIVAQVMGSMDGDITALDIRIYQELESLAGYIQTARSEIAAIRPDDIRLDHIPAATDELDAIVGATEEATGRILDAAEQIQTIAEGLEEPARSQLFDLSTGIFEASNFQDITGQRIGKVVRTLKHIETKIEALVGVLGEEVGRAQATAQPVEESDAKGDEKLLNGPQLPQNAIDQDEIDRLLASFD
ncbi:protein phosphatase CheZ [Inquilinus sp. CAU 1745]|uniref:protein phosphatase CheZ n=1 Tax=Inquilinus sp. CAU 1745 TaxID=3140369 RepID=UPI00325AB2D7